MSAFVGIDVGTGGVRILAVGESGEVLAEASSEYPLYGPCPGWSEQHPEGSGPGTGRRCSAG